MTGNKREWMLITLLAFIFVLKGVMWSLVFPLWQGPDEDDHYAVIQFIGENGRLPNENDETLPDEVTLSRQYADVGRLDYNPEQRQGWSKTAVGIGEETLINLPPATRSSTELGTVGKLMHATPLYYLIASIPYRLIGYDADLLTRAAIQRLFSVLVSSPIIIIAYLVACLLFPANSMMRLTIPTLVAFHPQLTAVTSIVSVDGFYFALYSLLIYLSLRVLRDGLNWRYSLAIGAAFAVGVLFKPTLTGFAPIVALVVFYDFWRGNSRRKQIFWAAVLMNIVILIPLSWWMARSWRLNQDLFYFNPVLKGHRILQNPFYDYAFFQHMFDYYWSIWGGIFTTWWAQFGWLDTPVAPWVYHLLRLLTVLAIIGLGRRLLQLKRRPVPRDRWNQVAPLTAWALLAFTILIPALLLQVYDLSFWHNFGNGRGLQGRYWLGTIIPMLTLFTLGLTLLLPKRWETAVHHSLRIGMVSFNFIALLAYIVPRYYL